MTLELTFLDVGNADCIIILPPEHGALVIDVPRSGHLRRWLQQRQINHIESIYITHGHRDHLPSLQELVTFLEQWFFCQQGTLSKLYLPIDVLRSATAIEAHLRQTNPHKQQQDRDALDRLELWRNAGKIQVLRSEKNNPYHSDALSIHVLHPDALFAEKFYGTNPTRLNDLSLVLRLEYGAFCALFPADIERDGLRDMLEHCTDADLRCHILKIPHHGAWQTDSAATEMLFMRADPELAILSVGSTNTHKHVKPGLFQALIQLRETHRLQHFICTEITRTCKHTAQERVEMNRHGLASRQPCAGDIIIVAEQSGAWSMRNQEQHTAYVNTIVRAACQGRADLRDDNQANNPNGLS